MKKRLFLLIILSLLLSNIGFSQSGWFWQNPLPQGNDLYSVKMIDANTAFACGGFGTILKTTNHGINWSIIRQDSGYTYRTFYFFNSNTGFVGGSLNLFSYLLKTTNCGLNWVSSYTFPMGNIYSVKFTDVNTGYVLGTGTAWGLIYKTINGGSNWDMIYSMSNCTFKDSFFSNNMTGYVCGTMGIIKTTNGGNNWVNQFQFTQSGSINSLSFIDNNTGIAVGVRQQALYSYQTILRTTNAGNNWVSMTGIGYNELSSVSMLNSLRGFACGSGLLIYTSNGGYNWFSIPVDSILGYASIDFSSTNGIMVGQDGLIMNTTNNGTNWYNMFPCFRHGYGVNCVRFLNKTIGYALTGNKVLKTINGGVNWVDMSTPTSKNLYTLSIIDSTVLYVAGGEPSDNQPVMLKSTNGGTTWITQDSHMTQGIVSINFVNSMTGYCLGWLIGAKTTNGGSNWNLMSSPGGFSIHFIDAQTGFIVGYTESFKTTNGGDNWFSIPVNGESIYFTSRDTGYVVAIRMSVKKTIDGGLNWIIQTQQSNTWRFYGLHFANSQVGIAVGDFGAIAKTTNGGLNWYYQTSVTGVTLNSVNMCDTNVCYITGLKNTILKTTNGGVPIGIVSNKYIIPNQIFLSQNYPNPFNPVTRIKFDLPKSSNVKLVIYDVLGREIETLIDENKKPGSYEVDWPATGGGSRYASGVYFYKLITYDYVQTKKMVLLK